MKELLKHTLSCAEDYYVKKLVIYVDWDENYGFVT